VEAVAKMFDAVDAERTVVTVGTATLGSADGFVRVFAVWCQNNHAPPKHSRHNNKINERVRINIKWANNYLTKSSQSEDRVDQIPKSECRNPKEIRIPKPEI
jgi:hypothetical protein